MVTTADLLPLPQKGVRKGLWSLTGEEGFGPMPLIAGASAGA